MQQHTRAWVSWPWARKKALHRAGDSGVASATPASVLPEAHIHPKAGVLLKYELTDGAGVHLYSFRDAQMIPFSRHQMASQFYLEATYKLKRETLQMAVAAIWMALADGPQSKESHARASTIAFNLLEVLGTPDRPGDSPLEYPTDLGVVMKVAATLYIDEHEDPYTFDYSYIMQKCNRWLNDKNLPAFFLKQPIANILNSCGIWEANEQQLTSILKLQSRMELGIAKQAIKSFSGASGSKDYVEYVTQLLSQTHPWMLWSEGDALSAASILSSATGSDTKNMSESENKTSE